MPSVQHFSNKILKIACVLAGTTPHSFYVVYSIRKFSILATFFDFLVSFLSVVAIKMAILESLFTKASKSVSFKTFIPYKFPNVR